MSEIRDGLSLLRKPDIRKLFAAYLISYIGTAMAPIAMAFGVLELTGSTKDAAIVIAAPTLAAIFVMLLGGALADRTSRQRILVFAELLAMLAQGLIAICFLSGAANIPVLTGLMLVNGIALAFNAPAATGFIPQLVEKEQLQAANALLGTARHGAVALGAALGGVLVAVFGAGMTMMIDAISFGISALLILTLKPKAQEPVEKASILEDLRVGWKEFISRKWMWVIVLQFSFVVAALEGVFGLVGPAVAKAQLNGAVDWGLISASFGIGTLVGGILAMKVKVKYPMRLGTLLVFFFCGVPLGLSLPLPVAAISLLAFVEGIAGSIFSVLWYTSVQLKVPPNLLSRVSAYDHLGSIVLAPLGILAAGFLYEAIGGQKTLIIMALVVFVPTCLAFSVKDVRMMRRD